MNRREAAREEGNADLAAVGVSAQKEVPLLRKQCGFAVGIVAENDAGVAFDDPVRLAAGESLPREVAVLVADGALTRDEINAAFRSR